MDGAATAASVLEAARGLDLLSDDGTLVMELERLTKIQIPMAEIKIEHFESIEMLCAWLERLSK
jgi:hypothetical protein